MAIKENVLPLAQSSGSGTYIRTLSSGGESQRASFDIVKGAITADMDDAIEAEAEARESADTQLETELNGKVDKVTGKGLSTNDFTNALKTKLDGIEAGAEVNTIETVKVNGTALVPDANRAVNVPAPTVDSALSTTSENPVQNKIITGAVNGIQADVDQNAGEITDLKEDLLLYNSLDLLNGELTKATGTSNGITFTWNGDVCTVTGSATNYAANILKATSALPTTVKAGNAYFFKYKTTNDSVLLRIIWKTSDNSTIRTDYASGDTVITVPSNAAKWTISLYVSINVSLETPAVVSQIGMLGFSDDYMAGRTTLESGTDLNNVKTEGHWVLSSGYTYPNSPLASGRAGALIVFKSSTNVITQMIVEIAANPNIYVRSSIGGAFSFAWSKLANIYNNSYNSEHYENTYNITCSPTITSDTNNYLASTGDNTDRTGDIQTMLNTKGVCHLGPGKFVVSGVDVPDYGSLIGSGIRTVIVLDANVTTGYAVKLKTQSSVTNMRINGGSTVQNTSPNVGTRHGILFEGTKASGQTGGTTYKRSTIDHCHVTNFSGGGITCTGTGVDLDSNLLISDCFVDHCCAGLYIPYYSEFHRIANCAFTYNWYGCVDNGGNNNFANCDFSGNKIGLLIDNSTDQSPNNSHGSFTNCSINHSYSDAGVINGGTAIKLLKSNLGEIFTGMQIFYGAIVLDDCVGTRFIGANIGSKVPITITDSTVVTFSDCTFKEGPNHADSPFTQNGNTVLTFTDCYLRDGTVYDPMS